jgi:hypothetical protein
MIPTRYSQIYKAAYDYSVSRTILRAHWNSDIMYGKLAGSVIAPIINAYNLVGSTNYRTLYQQAKTIIDNASSCGGGEDITFTLTIYNDLTVPVKLNGEMYMYMGNTDANTGKHCNEGGIALDGLCKHGTQGNYISIPAGGNKSFSVTIPAATVALRGNIVSNYRADNVILYSYGQLLDKKGNPYQGEISRAFYAYPMDSTTASGNRITLVNGSTHFVHIPPNVTVKDLEDTENYNQISHYKNSASQLTDPNDIYLW